MAKILRKSLAFFFDLLHLGNNLRVLYLRVEALVYLFLYKVRAYKYKIKLTMTHCNKKTTKAEIILFLSKIQLKWPESNLVRIGPKDDGGYVLPDDFDGVVANFSPGVGGVVGFEEELASMGIRSFMIDASVEKLPVENVVNIHPNNYNPIIKYKGIKVPPVLEFTFVRKDRISKVPKNAIPNLRLNSKNNKYLPDITLPSTWFA